MVRPFFVCSSMCFLYYDCDSSDEMRSVAARDGSGGVVRLQRKFGELTGI
jgi:hypothetical protein